MINLKGYVLPWVVLFAFVTCSSSGRQEADAQQSEWEVTIKGKVLNPQSGTIEIAEITEGGTTNGWKDKITLEADNSFSKKVTLNEPGYYRINFYDRQVINVILYKSDLTVTVDGSDMQGVSQIEGSPEIDFIRKANDILQEFQGSPEAAALMERFEEARQSGDRERVIAVQEEYMALASKKQEELAALIREQPASLGVINLLQSQALDKDKFYDTYRIVADKLKAEWPSYAHAQAFIEMVDGMQATAI